MPGIAAAEAQLPPDDRPVLFLDTCILLDVIRVRAVHRSMRPSPDGGGRLSH